MADLGDYAKATTPVTALPIAPTGGATFKYVVSLLKGWFGDEATAENEFCYSLLPKLEPGEDCSYMFAMDKMYQGKMRGGFIFGVNPMNGFPNTNKMRAAPG